MSVPTVYAADLAVLNIIGQAGRSLSLDVDLGAVDLSTKWGQLVVGHPDDAAVALFTKKTDDASPEITMTVAGVLEVRLLRATLTLAARPYPYVFEIRDTEGATSDSPRLSGFLNLVPTPGVVNG